VFAEPKGHRHRATIPRTIPKRGIIPHRFAFIEVFLPSMPPGARRNLLILSADREIIKNHLAIADCRGWCRYE
jgi:hypothetical protein